MFIKQQKNLKKNLKIKIIIFKNFRIKKQKEIIV